MLGAVRHVVDDINNDLHEKEGGGIAVENEGPISFSFLFNSSEEKTTARCCAYTGAHECMLFLLVANTQSSEKKKKQKRLQKMTSRAASRTTLGMCL